LNQPQYAILYIGATCALASPTIALAQTALAGAAPGSSSSAAPDHSDASVPRTDAEGDFEVEAATTAPPTTDAATAATSTSAFAPLAAVASPAPLPAVAAVNVASADASKEVVSDAKANAAVQAPPVDISGYAQLQYESHKDSEDQLRQGGALLNQNRFSVRRLRVTLSRRYQFSGYLVELDGNTTSGPALGLQRAEGCLFYQGNPAGQPALLELTAGLLVLPFGYEVPESSRLRWFTERTTASRAFFPSEVDVGVRLHGAWRFLRYGVALSNGEPKGTKSSSFQLQDPNKAKDVTLRVGAEVPAGDAFRVSGGLSYLAGKGFSAGDDATKSHITWNDTNQNGAVDVTSNNELSGSPATAAVASQNFRRWAVGADVQVRARSRLGWTTVLAEVVAANNLDRGLYVADPITTTRDIREFGWHVGFTQELTRYAIVGFRYDSYDPDSDLTDSRGGQILPTNQVIRTYSPLVGLTLPERARLIFQYDIVRDKLGRDNTGVPTDLANDQWTLRLQVNL
jgi:hypothetical protein